jgi:hypothetical protein
MSANSVSPPSGGTISEYIIVAWPVRSRHEPSVCQKSVPLSGCLPLGLPSSPRFESM